ncbi:hypothetical protein [Streptomyces sp. NPDC048659]|uniref:hypothetical protein n=1 Tax=Streptomyces sp. NPDC048659 TaxID=3155489 RepID=UPI003429158C
MSGSPSGPAGRARDRGRRRRAALVVSVLAFLSACSGGGAEAGGGGEDGAELALCREVFGEANVAAVRTLLTADGAPAESGSPDRIRTRMSQQARAWSAETDKLRRDGHDLCFLGAPGVGSRGWLAGRVTWSTLTMDSVTTGPSAKDWRRAGDGVYVQRLKRQNGLAVLSPCRLTGTAKGQERLLPLEVSVTEEGLSATDPGLTGRSVSGLLAYTRELLDCQNTVAVPDELTA